MFPKRLECAIYLLDLGF